MRRVSSGRPCDIGAIVIDPAAGIDQQHGILCQPGPAFLLIVQNRGFFIQGNDIGIGRLVFQSLAGSQIGLVYLVFTAASKERLSCRCVRQQSAVGGLL